MTAIHRHLLVALLTVLTLMVSSEAQFWTENRIINGCRFEPNVRHAAVMDCNYDGINYTQVRSTYEGIKVYKYFFGTVTYAQVPQAKLFCW